MQWIAFIFIIITLFVRGFWPGSFKIDKFSIGLLFLVAIPLLAPYLKKAKWFGAEFVFRDEIKKLEPLVQKSEQQAKEAEEKGETLISIFDTFSTNNSLNLLNSDPNLSLAALRIKIEEVLSKATNRLFNIRKNKKIGNRFYISKLLTAGIISAEQGEALNTIVSMCNRAIHGAQVSVKEAREIISITERLNRSFCVGYSINFEANKHYSQQGIFCEWEHCIEHFPLKEEANDLSCPVFGHDCPGGRVTRNSCNRTVEDFPKKRFIKNA